MKKKLALALAALLLLATTTACAGAAATTEAGVSSMAVAYDTTAPQTALRAYDNGAEKDVYFKQEETADSYEADEVAVEDPAESPVLGGGAIPEMESEIRPDAETRKIVYTLDISLQTTQFDEGVKKIPELVESLGGFVQDSYVEGTNLGQKYISRSASFTVRVPSDKLTGFTTSLGDTFHIVYQQKHSSDITASYYDTQARLDSLHIQEERLQEMLKSSEELQYLLEVERELANVLYQIESITSSLRRMDQSVSYSTVTIALQEVSTIDETEPVAKPATFGERVNSTLADSWDSFVDFCQSVALALVGLIPFLPLLLIIAVVVLLLVRHNRKLKARRNAKSNSSPVEIGAEATEANATANDAPAGSDSSER